MVYFSGLESIIESIYLSEELGDKIGSCNIFINPTSISYLTKRVIIINKNNYPESNLRILISNQNKIISRIKIDNSSKEFDSIEFEPYILRPVFNIVWGGDELILDDINEDNTNLDYDSLLDKILESCVYMSEKNKLLFPKVFGTTIKLISEDNYENLTSIGYALQQVGINLKTETPFIDMDILKTKKMNL